ncbi:MAG: PQQ-binding-like beta-propeller repeat protein [Hyphomicrobiales bacterium]
MFFINKNIYKLFILLLFFTLTACESFIRGKEDILPGQRESILLSSELPKTSEQQFILNIPNPKNNPNWVAPIKNTSNNLGNLAYSENFIKNWSTDIGVGTSKDNFLTIAPILIDNIIFVVDSENRLSAINASNGTIIWSKGLYPEQEEPKVGFGGGLFANSGMIFYTNGFGEVYALDPYNGEILWQENLNSPVRSAPIANNSALYVLNVDNQILSFDIQSGDLLWDYTWFSDSAGFIQSSNMAMYKNSIIVPYRSGEIFVFDASSGKRIWADTINRKNIKNSLSQIKDIVASPVINNDFIVTVGSNGRVIANNIENGFRIWELAISSSITPLLVGDYIFLLGDDNILYAITLDKGEIIWMKDLKQGYEFKKNEAFISMLMINNKIHFFSLNGGHLVVSPENGEISKIETNKFSDMSIPPIVVNNNLYVISDNGELTSFR